MKCCIAVHLLSLLLTLTTIPSIFADGYIEEPDQDSYAFSGGTISGTEIDVGFRAFQASTNEYRAALRFSLPSSFTNAFIQSATLRLYYFDAWGNFADRTVNAHRLLQAWTETGPVFNASKSESFTSATVGGTNFRFISWDVTDAARVWAANPATNFGMILVSTAGGLSDNAFRFYSRESAGEPAFHPLLQITYATTPSITEHPSSQSILEGGTATFSVRATGSEPVSYQWRKDSQSIAGATSATLSFSNVQLARAGSYDVVVSNAAGAVTSSTAILTVLNAPSFLQQPVSLIWNLGSNATFSVQATGTLPIHYQWFHDGVALAGADQSSLTITNARYTDAGQYQVLITNTVSGLLSQLAMLTIQALPPEAWRVPFAVTNVGLSLDSPLLTEDPSGAVILVASIITNLAKLTQTSRSILISKVNRGGTKLWETHYQEPYNRELEPQSLATDRLGNIYIGGLAFHSRLFLMKLSPDGQRLWASEHETGFGATEILLDPSGFITTWTVGLALSAAWDPVKQFDIWSWDAGGWTYFDGQGNFRNSQPNGNGQPIPATVRVTNATTFSMLGWGGSDFGIKNLDMPTDTYLEFQSWSSLSAPPPNNVLVRESPAGVHVAQMTNGVVTLELLTRTGSPLWQIEVPFPRPLLDIIPALEVDAEGNSFLAVFYRNGTTNDVAFCRVRSTGAGVWLSRYSDSRSPTNLAPADFLKWKSLLRLIPDGGGGLYALVGWNDRFGFGIAPEALRFSARGTRLWDLAEPRSVPAIGDLLVRAPLLVSADESMTLAVRDFSGGSPTARLFLVRREMGTPPTPMGISIPATGATIATNLPLEVAAAPRGANSNIDYVEFFLDGRWVADHSNWLSSFTLGPLTAGSHTLQTRTFDLAGNFSWSPQSLVYGGQASPPTVISSNDLQKVVFATYATEALLRGETNFDGALNSALISVIAAIHREMPELRADFYARLIDGVRARAATIAPAAFSAAASPQPPTDPDAKLKFWLTQIPMLVKDYVEDIPVIGRPLANQMTRALQEIARRCDEDPASAVPSDCNIVKFYDIKWRDVSDVVTMARDDIISSQETLFARFSSGIWHKMDMQTDVIIEAFNSEFGGVNDQFGKVLGNLRTLMDGQNQLIAGQNAFHAEFASFSADVRAGMSQQLAITGDILKYQQNIWGFLTNQAARAESSAKNQYAAEIEMKGLESSVYLLTTLIDLGGNHDLARKVSAVGENSLKLYNAITAFNKDINTADLSQYATSAILSANVVSIGLSLAQSMQDTGPTADEIILQQLAALQNMIVDLGKQMHDRFDRVDRSLNAIYEDFSLRFSSIDFRLGQIQGQLIFLQNSLSDISQKLDAIQRAQYLLAKDALRAPFAQAVNRAQGWSPGFNTIPYAEFNDLRAYFYSYATSNSQYEAFSPAGGLLTGDDQVAQSLTAAGGLPASLSYLARLAAERNWLGITSQFRGAQPNPIEWEAGVSEYLNVIESWPLMARSTPVVSNNLVALRLMGDKLNNALQELSLTYIGGQLRANRAFWEKLFNYYRGKAAGLTVAFEEIDRIQRLLQIAGGFDGDRTNGALTTSLWGPLLQSTYLPIPFRAELVLHAPADHFSFGGSLRIGDTERLLARLESAGVKLPLFAELLGLCQTDFQFTNSFSDSRIRRACAPLSSVIESRFTITTKGAYRLTSNGTNPTPWFSTSYVLPEFHFYSVYFGSDWGDRIYARPGDLFGCYNDPQTWWASPQALLSTFWDGGWEPDSSDRRQVTAIKDIWVTNSTLTYQLSAASELERLVENRLRALQMNFYATVANDLQNTNAVNGNSSAKAAAGLTGARAVLEYFIRLAFPRTYESDDSLRGFFYGSEPLPDAVELTHLCTNGMILSSNSADHRDRIEFDQILNQRLDALQIVISNKLTEIELARQAESLPVLTSTLERIAAVQSLVSDPLVQPSLQVSAYGTNSVTVLLRAQGNIPFALGYSTNLPNWTDFNPPVILYDNNTRIIAPNGNHSLFLRANVAQ